MDKNFVNYLKTLISFKSITPESRGAIEFISDLLKKHGFKVEVKEFGQEYKVQNLYASYGKGSPNICFCGHVDVVPPGDIGLWDHDPFEGVQKGDKIFGRGAVDMKGAIACMLASALDFIKFAKNLKGSVSFLLTSDEEGEAKYGTSKMLEYLKTKGEEIDFMIVGEPSCEEYIGDTIKIGRRGSINFVLKITGRQGHVAYPKKADNPLNYLVNILHDLKNLKLDEGNDFFQSSELVITSIDTRNHVANVIPASASANFNIRFNNLHNSQTLVDLINQKVETHTKKFKLESQLSAKSFIQDPIDRIEDFAKIVRSSTNIDTKFSTSGGTSDARFAIDYCNVVEFGLMSNEAHKINEFTKISDLQKLYNVYYDSLNKFLK